MIKHTNHGFTLIEMSIVLIVIGLLVGGILVGQDLIKSSRVQATITQLDQYNSAVDTFTNKYGYLPGDIPPTAVTTFGFSVIPGSQRSGTAGLGNGDNLIDGWNNGDQNHYGCDHVGGENAWFWEDLSSNSGLIEGGFQTATATAPSQNVNGVNIGLYLPEAKLGGGNYFSICEQNSTNYFVISTGLRINANVNDYCSVPGITVAQAYYIDKKIDDGFPQTGFVTAQFQNNPNSATCGFDGAPRGTSGLVWTGASDTSATPGSSTTCYDNGNSAGAVQNYSNTQNNGNGLNCALAIQMQSSAR